MDPNFRSAVARLSNHELLAQVKHLAQRERQVTASLIAHLAELDSRQLYLAEGYSSLFAYCTHMLQLSEHAAYGRIQAARLILKFPVILERLEEGSMNLTALVLLAPHFTQENHQELLEMARQKSRREVEQLVAGLRPQPPVPASVRRIPTIRHKGEGPIALQDDRSNPQLTVEAPAETSQAVTSQPVTQPARPAVLAPMAPQRYMVKFTASAETYEKLRRAQDLLRHQIPEGDPAAIFDRALTALLEKLAKQKFAATNCPRGSRGAGPGSRHIPAQVKRAVWLRDGGQCAFVAGNGHRCIEQGFLEFHHVDPFAAGGEPTVENIQLRCRAHNGYEAEVYFGPANTKYVSEERGSYITTQHSHLRPGVSTRNSVRTEFRVALRQLELTDYRIASIGLGRRASQEKWKRMATRDWYCEDVLSGKLEVTKVWEDERVLAFHHPSRGLGLDQTGVLRKGKRGRAGRNA